MLDKLTLLYTSTVMTTTPDGNARLSSDDPQLDAAPFSVSKDVERAREEGDKHSLDEKEPRTGGEIDYEKMENQQIGVTRIETLWRHFGDNKPVLTALGLSIFRKYLNLLHQLLLKGSRLLCFHLGLEYHWGIRAFRRLIL